MWEYNYSELYHHGIKGMHWGVRRYQNYDGTLTAAGRKRYLNEPFAGSPAELNNRGKKRFLNQDGTLNEKGKRVFQKADGSLTDEGKTFYQNRDGTLTAEGKKRFLNSDGTLNEEGKKLYLNPDGSLTEDGKRRYGAYETGVTGALEAKRKIYDGSFVDKLYDKDPADIDDYLWQTTLHFMYDEPGYRSKLEKGESFAKELLDRIDDRAYSSFVSANPGSKKYVNMNNMYDIKDLGEKDRKKNRK